MTNSFLFNRQQFSVKINDNFSIFESTTTGIPRGLILGPALFIYIYKSDIGQTSRTSLAIFVNNTTIYTAFRNIEATTVKLRNHLNILSSWYNYWKISINSLTSVSV